VIKTLVVLVESHRNHPLYKKTMKKVKRYKVHDEKNECKIGDTVKNRGNPASLQREEVACRRNYHQSGGD